VKVDRRWWATSVVRVRILAAGLILLAAGCSVLGWSFHSRQSSPSATVAEPSLPAALEGMGTSKAGLNSKARSLFAGLPLMFEPNQGQANLDPADPRAKFVARGSRYSLFLGLEGAILSVVSEDPSKPAGANQGGQRSAARVETVEMKLAGANANPALIATDRLPGQSNYFIGNDPKQWHTAVPQFARVRYENVYPGINLVFYGNQGHLEYDFQVAPGSDPSQAELEFLGAKKLELSDGALVIQRETGSVRLDAPVVYQEIEGRRQPVEGRFVLRGSNRAGFAIGAYDPARELIIDPVLDFSTYFGGSGDELATSVAVDGSFNIYLAGSTNSTNLPTTPGSFQTALNGAGPNVYIAKITPPLGSIVATLDAVTYLGGSGSDTPVGINVDGDGDPFVAGTTTSANFPTTPTNAYQSTPTSGSACTPLQPATATPCHVFVTKMKFDFTSLLYSSYLSGNGSEAASGMTIDAAGNLYVTGTTTSNNVASASVQFPASTLPNAIAFQQNSIAAIQFFVTKVNTSGSGFGSIPYSTYFGGANFNPPAGQTTPTAQGGGIAVDIAGDMYFTGTTNFTYTGCSGCSSTDFPILDAYQPCLDVSPPTVIVNPPTCANSSTPILPDAFVAKINPNGSQGQQLLWSTYIGGSQSDAGVGIALDIGAANVYVVGTTDSWDFVNAQAITTYASFQKCLNNIPTNCTAQPTEPAPSDAFVAKLTNVSNAPGTANPVNVSLNYFSYLGGANNETGTAITVDSSSGALITGTTQSPVVPPITTAGNFPVNPYPNSLQSQLTGAQDAFVARLNTSATVTSGNSVTASWASYFGGSTTSASAASTTSGTGIALDVNQNTYLAGSTNAVDLQVSKPVQAANAGGYDAFVTQLGTAVSISITGVLTLGTSESYISAGNPATFTYTITNNGPDLASSLVATNNLSTQITGVSFTNVAATISSGTCGGGGTNTSVSCGPISLQSGATATMTVTATPTASSSGSSPITFNGGTVQVLAPGNIVLAQTSVPAQMSDYGMAVTPSNQTVPVAGDTATYTVQLTPHPFYSSSITLSCSNLPSGTSCNFNPASSNTLQSTSGATVTLSIPTTARPITTPASLASKRLRFYAIWLTLPGLLILGIGGTRRPRVFGALLFGVLFIMLLSLPACNHSTTQAPVSGTQAGSYTVTVTAASGTDSKSTTIGLNVP
jgi:Domain of unknown function DUF11/Beta-propeller repeat